LNSSWPDGAGADQNRSAIRQKEAMMRGRLAWLVILVSGSADIPPQTLQGLAGFVPKRLWRAAVA
jgi:hypothetical protein